MHPPKRWCRPRPNFIERARKTYAIVATSEEANYANILLRKGVVR
ncbi:RbsD/FucU domain-containing protein [uncultured Parolsenella sp.]|nr:RbsD/FucU domain-containing protein [uncultured Parolsenella sp.]